MKHNKRHLHEPSVTSNADLMLCANQRVMPRYSGTLKSRTALLLAATFHIGSQAWAASYQLAPIGGPVNVTMGSPVTVSFDASSVPSGAIITSATMTADWSDGGGFAYSSDARAQFPGQTTGGAAQSGAQTNGNSTQLTWTPSLSGTIQSTFDVTLSQEYWRGSTAIFENLAINLEEYFFPHEIEGNIDLDSGSTCLDMPYENGEILWWEVNHPGGALRLSTAGSDFDTELGVYSISGNRIANNDDGGPGLTSLINTNIPAGTYHVVASAYSTYHFSSGHNVTHNSTRNGQLHLCFGQTIPEPSSALLAGVALGIGLLRRRRASVRP